MNKRGKNVTINGVPIFINNEYGQAYNTFKEISKSKGKEVFIEYGLEEQSKWIVEYVDLLENKIDKILEIIDEIKIEKTKDCNIAFKLMEMERILRGKDNE